MTLLAARMTWGLVGACLLGCATARVDPAPMTNAPASQANSITEDVGPMDEEAPAGDPLQAPKDVAAVPPGAQLTPSGLASRVLHRGTGTIHPGTFSTVRVNYTGWTTDGRMFDSSVQRGTPAEFPLNGVILGWRQGVKLMVVGEKRRFWIPEELAYKGASGPQGMLVFDVELLKIVEQ